MMKQCELHCDGGGDGIITFMSAKAMKLRAEACLIRNSMSLVPLFMRMEAQFTNLIAFCMLLTDRPIDRTTARTNEPLVSTEQYDILPFVNTPENEEKE
jgi:hypothetical protein